jgi:hypothetical protein
MLVKVIRPTRCGARSGESGEWTRQLAQLNPGSVFLGTGSDCAIQSRPLTFIEEVHGLASNSSSYGPGRRRARRHTACYREARGVSGLRCTIRCRDYRNMPNREVGCNIRRSKVQG